MFSFVIPSKYLDFRSFELINIVRYSIRVPLLSMGIISMANLVLIPSTENFKAFSLNSLRTSAVSSKIVILVPISLISVI